MHCKRGYRKARLYNTINMTLTVRSRLTLQLMAFLMPLDHFGMQIHCISNSWLDYIMLIVSILIFELDTDAWIVNSYNILLKDIFLVVLKNSTNVAIFWILHHASQFKSTRLGIGIYIILKNVFSYRNRYNYTRFEGRRKIISLKTHPIHW